LTIPKLSQDILVAAREHGRVTVRDLERLTGANRNTIKVHLKALVQKRQLTQEGRGKGTWYRL
jgi:predicted HTH transcriptional regulator